jgi:hypothetical protein
MQIMLAKVEPQELQIFKHLKLPVVNDGSRCEPGPRFSPLQPFGLNAFF